MSVYVDKLYNHGWRLYGRPVLSCHLFADGLEELIKFGATLGLSQKDIHIGNGNFIHFDLVKSKRDKAIEFGAIYLRGRELINKLNQLKRGV